MNDTLAKRLWSKVVQTDTGCLEYMGARVAFGYGAIRGRRDDGSWTMLKAHRAAWTLTNGPIPEGMYVCHRCDNPPCVNVEHLFLGDDADNMADKCAKGRQSREFDFPHTKLSDAQVTDIRTEYAAGGISQYALGRKYGVSQSHVSFMVNGKVRAGALQ